MAGGRRPAKTSFVLSAVLCAMAFAGFGASAAFAEEPSPEGPPENPAAVAIPFEDVATIEAAPPWRIADCAVPKAASPLVVGCDGTKIDLAAPEYDPEAGIVIVPVPLVHGSVTTTVPYTVTLEGPATPTATPSSTIRPVPAGGLLRVPISELGVECEICGEGGRLRVSGVAPAEAGSAWATPTHLVFRAAQGYRGPADVIFAFADDYGTWSADAVVLAEVYRSTAAPLVSSDVVVPIAANGPTTVDLSALSLPTDDAEVLLVSCGAAMHGALLCAEDGTASYTGSGAVDQVMFHVATTAGEHAYGSVTFVPAASDRLAPGPVPIDAPKQKGGVPTAIVPPEPVESEGTGADGALDAVFAVLDRVGAR